MPRVFARIGPLGIKILGCLLLVFLLTMAAILGGMWTYQRQRLIEITTDNALQAGQIVKAGLRASMLQNDRNSSQRIIKEMISRARLSRISIMDKQGRIVLSSEAALEGQQPDKLTDPSCAVCHPANGARKKGAVVIEGASGPLLRSVIAIENQPACQRCHAAAQPLIGILMVDTSLRETYALLTTMAKRFLVTGVASFLVVVLLVAAVINRFVSTPARALMEGIKRVEQGDFSHWVQVTGRGEFSEMADAFNVMSRAIGRYITEIREKQNEISTLYTIVQRMSETIEWRKVKEIVTDLLIEILKVETVALVIPDEAREGCFTTTWKTKRDRRHYHQESCHQLEKLPGEILSRTEIDLWLANEFRGPTYNDNDRKLLVPLTMNTMKLGLLCALKPEHQAFDRADKKIIPVLAHHITTSFANARLYSLATTDALTGLFTKRYLDSKLRELEEEWLLHRQRFCLLMLDLDHFKEVNDTHGHQVGDQVLAAIAASIRQEIRKEDIPCRYGGEEMAVLLPDCTVDTASFTAERLRKRIGSLDFKFNDQPPFHKTVSIGVACFPSHGATLDALTSAADRALYRAKQKGRNRVELAKETKEPPPPATP